MQIRKLLITDLPKLFLIETASQVSPWSQAAFERCWESKFPGWVVSIDDEVVAFVFISLAAGECHILNISVHPDNQRQGIGRNLLNHVMTWAKDHGAKIIFLEVRRSNYAAINLYKSMEFRLIGERKSYYQTLEGSEDALVFGRDLGYV